MTFLKPRETRAMIILVRHVRDEKWTVSDKVDANGSSLYNFRFRLPKLWYWIVRIIGGMEPDKLVQKWFLSQGVFEQAES